MALVSGCWKIITSRSSKFHFRSFSVLSSHGSKNGRDLNTLVLEEAELISDVEFATTNLQAARLAADNSRRESQRQLKFVVILSQPQLPVSPDQNWRWQAFLGSIGIIIVAWGVGGFLINAMRKS